MEINAKISEGFGELNGKLGNNTEENEKLRQLLKTQRENNY
jgi:hypothetical protein